MKKSRFCCFTCLKTVPPHLNFNAKKLLEEDLLTARDKMKSYLVEERSHKMDVLKQKLETSRSDVKKLEKENLILQKQIEDCRVQVGTLSSDKSALKRVVKQTKLENKELFEQIAVYESVLKEQERELMNKDKKNGERRKSTRRRRTRMRKRGDEDDGETY